MERTDSFLLDLGLMPMHPGACQPEPLHWQAPASYRIYNIGNSHTWDHRPATGFREIARAMDLEISNGWHINCGQNLHTIWYNPEQACVELTPFGNFKQAISDYHWDAITIQPFVNGLGKDEAESIRKLYEFIRSTGNSETDVFVYCTWPKNTGEELSDFDYTEAWLAEYSEQDTLRNLSEGFFAFLEESVKEYAGDVSFVRVGRVMYHFDQKAKSGLIPGFSGAGELYRDRWHLNNVGRYMAGLSMFSAILGMDPDQVSDFDAYPPSEDWPGDRELTAELKKAIREVLTEVR